MLHWKTSMDGTNSMSNEERIERAIDIVDKDYHKEIKINDTSKTIYVECKTVYGKDLKGKGTMSEDYWEHEKLIQLETEKQQRENQQEPYNINQMVFEFFTSITDIRRK